MILYGFSNACVVWISLKTLYSLVLVTFTQDRYLSSWIHPSTHPGSFSVDRMNNSKMLSRYKIHFVSSSSYNSCKATACLPIVREEIAQLLDFPASHTKINALVSIYMQIVYHIHYHRFGRLYKQGWPGYDYKYQLMHRSEYSTEIVA